MPRLVASFGAEAGSSAPGAVPSLRHRVFRAMVAAEPFLGEERAMHRLILALAALALAASSAAAAMVERKIGYDIDGKAFEGVLVYDDAVKAKRPAILMEPDWAG